MITMKVFRHQDHPVICHNNDRHRISAGDEDGEDDQGRVFCSKCAKDFADLSACASAHYWKTEEKAD